MEKTCPNHINNLEPTQSMIYNLGDLLKGFYMVLSEAFIILPILNPHKVWSNLCDLYKGFYIGF